MARIARSLLWLLWQPFRFVGWVLHELGTQAVDGAKKAFAPLLWPIVGLATLVALWFVLGPEEFTQLVENVLGFGIVSLFCWWMFRIVFPKKKAKKKK